MTGSNLTPRGPEKPEIIDAEFEEVRDDEEARDGTEKASFRDLTGWLKDEGPKAVRDLLMIVGAVMVLIIILSIFNQDNGDEASSPQSNAFADGANAEALAAQADAAANSVEAEVAEGHGFNAETADLTAYAIAEDGAACRSDPVRQRLSVAMHDYMTKFLTTPKPAYLLSIDKMMPPMRPAIARQFLESASMDWDIEPVQTTWDIFGNQMYLQCEGKLSIEIPAFKDDGTAAVFTFSPLEWAIIFPTDLSGDFQVMIHDRPEEYGRKIFLDTAGQTMSLASINSLLQ